MTSLVYNGITFSSQLENIEFTIGLDGKVYASSGKFWPDPIPEENKSKRVKISKNRKSKNTGVASIIRAKFSNVKNKTFKIKANHQDTIRKAFVYEGWKAKVERTKVDGTYNVTRVA